ncbi:transposase DNA-binding-containing protein [Bradyrhizobium sp. CCBAU 53340]|uniref:transposase DNA-binding-containing protein n=1 Tax=Bradyrhizobium sp. CCBAU 53340 TaxID=1325112 RepID=UPI00188BB019|nr:transposase DNA-binding-containing protein [Bradyrhizobium sp. CCBAU 53340]
MDASLGTRGSATDSANCHADWKRHGTKHCSSADWANTKAAYRFFSNERVSEVDILAGDFQSTRDRPAAAEGLFLMLHDTTGFSYERESPMLGWASSR